MTMIQGRVVSEVNTCDAMKIIYCKILKVLQHFLQYFESFAILSAILSFFAILFAILQYVAILTMLL